LHLVRGRPDDGGGRLDGVHRLLVGQAGLLLCFWRGDAVPDQHVQRADGRRLERDGVHRLPGHARAADADDGRDVAGGVR
jgi:hypothetical protein